MSAAGDDPQPGSRPSRLPPTRTRPVLVRDRGYAAAAAIVLLALHTDSAITAAGLLAAAAAGTALAGGWLRSRQPDTADVAPPSWRH